MMSLQEYIHFHRLVGEYCWFLLSFGLDRRLLRPLFCSTMAAVKVEFRQIEITPYRHDTCVKQALEASVAAPLAEMIARDLIRGFRSPVWQGVHGQKLPLNASSELIEDVIEHFIQGYFTHISTFRNHKMRENKLIELRFGHFDWYSCHDSTLFFWPRPAALGYTTDEGAKKFKVPQYLPCCYISLTKHVRITHGC